jgi:hypothetical protein
MGDERGRAGVGSRNVALQPSIEAHLPTCEEGSNEMDLSTNASLRCTLHA